MPSNKNPRRRSEFKWSDFPRRQDAEGRNLCRWCGKVVKGRRSAWCNSKTDDCRYQVMLRVDWNTIRREILRRDGYRCVICKAARDWKRELEIDHITPLADGGSFWNPANLRTLCHDCHARVTREWKEARYSQKDEENPVLFIMESRTKATRRTTGQET